MADKGRQDAQDEDIPVGVASLYGSRTGKGLVHIHFGDQKGVQITPTAARLVAALLYECADAAEGDQFMMTFQMQRVGLDLNRAGQMLREYRQFREAQGREDDNGRTV